MALIRREQGVRDDELTAEASGARPDPVTPQAGIAGLIQRVFALKPVRVFLHYATDNGPLIASGMTYQAIFALFAALWFSFSVLGFVLAGNEALQIRVFATINGFIPNLIAYGPFDGAIPADTLLSTTGLSVGGAISLVGVLFTAVGFLGTLRTAIRVMFGLPGPTTNPVLLKAKDLGYTIAFGAVVLFTAALSVITNTVLDSVLALLGLRDATVLQQAGASAATFALLLLIDTALLAGAMRILSGIPIPLRRLAVGALAGGLGLAALQTLSTFLLSGATRNPVIGVFATLVGILIYFNLVCQVILIAASWVAVGMQDAGIDARSLSPEQRQQERAEAIEDARRLIATANKQALEGRVRSARGLQRWRLARELQQEVRAEARRRKNVPTVTEYKQAQQATGAEQPDARQVEQAVEPE